MHPFSFWLFISTCSILSLPAFSGQLDDTIHVEEITVEAPKLRYQPGVKMEAISSEKVASLGSSDLGTALSRVSSIYIRSYAGGLSTVHLRGTAPEHTAILFDGENFNSLTLGHSNMANIPMFFFDAATVQYGGSGAVYGSGAIGGTVQLMSDVTWKKGTSLMLQEEAGSFGTWFSGAKVRYGTGKLELSTKAYYKCSRNDFPFLNTENYNPELKVYPIEKQRNAAYEYSGILQELHYKLSPHINTFVKYYLNNSWHQSQPIMSANNDEGNGDESKDRHERLWGGAKFKYETLGDIAIKLSYIRDYLLYDRLFEIGTRRFVTTLDYEKSVRPGGNLNAGMRYTYIKPEVYAYNTNRKQQGEIFLLYSQSLFKNTHLAINLRELLYTNNRPQLCPAINISQNIRPGENSLINLTGSLSRSYRHATLNDTEWPNAGNPNLLPEDGVTVDAGVGYNYCQSSNYFNLKINAYYMLVDNWIQWRPVTGESWVPENYKKVRNTGIEPAMNGGIQGTKLQLNYSVKYSYNQAIQIATYSDSSQLHKQLAYKPKHLISASIGLEYRKWRLNPEFTYTGERLTSEKEIDMEEESLVKTLKAYPMINAEIGRKITINKSQFDIAFRVNNITNYRYQNIAHYAMPGINWNLSLRYLFDSSVKK